MNEYRDHWEQSIGNKNSDWDKQDDSFRSCPDQTVGFGTPQSVMNPAMQETPVYIPTPFIVPPKIEVGENWFVKLPGWHYVFTSEILEVTEKTVKIKFGTHPPPQRYKKSDVEFIEKVE